MTFSPEQTALLAAPLDKAVVKKNPKGFDYVEAWHAIAEANRIFGFDAWNRETVEMRLLGEPRQTGETWRVGYFAKVRITVGGIVREGCGFGSGINKDVDQAHEGALKEAESDAMKRAFMTFGNPFGLALYDKTQANVAAATPQPPSDPPEESAPSLEDKAITHLRTCAAVGKAQFKDAWEAGHGGWKKTMEAPAYARVVGEMKRLAAAFPKDEPEPPSPQAAEDFGLTDDEIPY